jgi:hypothetical protein
MPRQAKSAAIHDSKIFFRLKMAEKYKTLGFETA